MLEEIIQARLKSGVRPDEAKRIADLTEEAVRWKLGDAEWYIHSLDIEKRNAMIMAEYYGKNQDTLC